MLTRTCFGRAVLTFSLGALGGCSGEAPPEPAAQTPSPSLITDAIPAGFPAGSITTRAPSDNALTDSRAELGKRLFYDTRLSRTSEVACATCHEQEHAFAEPDVVSTGVEGRTGSRNAPALMNLAWSESFFWDGRTPTLEEQAGKPIENPDEMDLPIADAVARVAEEPSYVSAFLAAYEEPPTEVSLRKALASFVRTLVSANSAYDRHLRGDDTSFDEAAERGEVVFLSDRGGCFHCHPAGMLTNEGLFNNGTYAGGADTGRQLVTGRSGDTGKFKVPGLRNVELTAPYMHDGSLATLEAVIDQYDRGGGGDPTTDPQIVPLSLTSEEKADLLAFLRSLTDPDFPADPRFRP
jgi:cytochrome c peroxidase